MTFSDRQDTVFERETPAKRQEYLLVCGREIEALLLSKKVGQTISFKWANSGLFLILFILNLFTTTIYEMTFNGLFPHL